MENTLELQSLIEKYFDVPDQQVVAKAGDILLEQDVHNDRLYLVKSGVLDGMLRLEDGSLVQIFESQPGQVVGLYSFFSEEQKSYATVVARTDCTLAYIDKRPETQPNANYQELYHLFLPLLVNEISARQHVAQQAAKENELNLRQLYRSEKMATLGQMAAGLAHELNNAVGVLDRKTQWLSEVLDEYLKEKDKQGLYHFFELGRDKGQFMSTSEIRKLRALLEKTFGLDEEEAGHLAKTGLSPAELAPFKQIIQEKLHRLMYYWEIGATVHDMTVAAKQATHVVRSVKQLGVSGNTVQESVDLNYTIEQSLTILRSLLKNLQVELALGEIPPMLASPGALMQIWVNLIKNAGESLIQNETPNPVIRIQSVAADQQIVVRISDNGAGIPESLQPQIFRPDVTTKKEGLHFGLGLGLSIVQNLVFDHDGTISFTTKPGETIFTVTFPLRHG